MVAIIDEGVFINDSSRLPILDFFLIKSIWYLCNEKIELSVIEKNPERRISPKIKIIKNKLSYIRIYEYIPFL